ncbi:MAG: hypothetical protein LBL86_10565 [Coriobacteriales bacterium]|jgi:hypothetical protein|nr:hypothetical protein [Coriobacteriales bacterium]
MPEDLLLDEIKSAPPEKRNAILSYAYFVLHGESLFAQTEGTVRYVPFMSYNEVDDFLEFHQREMRGSAARLLGI